ncbi:type VI secretion system lipoprotein TssJ [Pseudorhizobium xiangyangii]|uniref:type VI secretion system lipoprotein TssJ n=1 Tax=Pseudorhizobium xiangyangii TaxID=2883104 RepID=UPI00210227AA|nr:type VI secretion system lipoprotein TssJ [Neorhizobium xiangyangii]
MGKIAMDPDLPIGPPKEQPSTATITLYSEPGANRTNMADAPVDVWIFELAGDDQLMSADFLNLSQDPKATLGVSYVRHQTKQVSPGQSEVLPSLKLKEDTAFIGVAVGFASLDNATWRAVEKVKAVGEIYTIVIPIRKNKAAIQIHR